MTESSEPAGSVGPARIKSLVLWSGGLDSTYSLVRLLRETGDEVHAHHVHCNVSDRKGLPLSHRCEYESRAVAAMLPVLRSDYRRFDYSESRVDLSAFGRGVRDTTAIMYFGAQAAIVAGLTPFDRIVIGVNADDDWDWRARSHACELRRLHAVRLLKAMWECEEVPFLYLWDPRPSKAEERAYLGPEIAMATASCREPVARVEGFAAPTFEGCGECPQCRVLGPLREAGPQEPGASIARSGARSGAGTGDEASPGNGPADARAARPEAGAPPRHAQTAGSVVLSV